MTVVDVAVSPKKTSRDVLAANKTKTMNAPYLSQHVRFQRLESKHIKKSDPDYVWKSTASNFARGGINYQGKNWIRDPRSGVWFENTPNKEFPGYEPAPIGAYVSRYKGDDPRLYSRRATSAQIEMDPSVTNGGTVTSLGPLLQRCNSAPSGEMAIQRLLGTEPGSPKSPLSPSRRKYRPPAICPSVLPGASLRVFQDY